jgi:pyruvate ferredoxin oxidoreductase delta subunit
MLKKTNEIKIGGVLGPGTSVSNKTGGWRTFRPKYDYEKCIRSVKEKECQVCWLLCPDGVIIEKNGKYEVDLDYCKGCGICAEECPFGAIKMVREIK